MPRVPFIGRLFWREYLALIASIFLVFLEIVAHAVAFALPRPILQLLYRSSRKLFNYLSSPQGRRSRNKKKAVVTSIAQASDFVELCEVFGYYAEEHIVQTKDGFLLGLHRLGWRRGEEEVKVNSGEGSVQKKVVYLHHGLLMNSEVWVCLTEKERCLPFELVDQGYDVWLGNNRGNKYSKKSARHSPNSTKFWSFSIDEFAFYDIPDTINYILDTTSRPSLSYIGFSQGTAQAFATLSIHPTLNDKVDVFIALAPAMSPSGLTSGIVDSLIKTSPEVIFLAFGRRSILSSTTMWQSILYPPIFVRVIDMALSFLFGWHSRNIPAHQKLAAYPHLYSFTSTKSVVHWFQIIRNGTFQMYDDEVQGPFSAGKVNMYYKPAKFPTRNIRTPIVLVYGGSDSLVDISVMLHELPKHTQATEIPHFEHLDFLWASDVDKLVFPHVFSALEKYSDPAAQKPAISSWIVDDYPKAGPSELISEDETPNALKVSQHVSSEDRRHSASAAFESLRRSVSGKVFPPTSPQSARRPGTAWSSDDPPDTGTGTSTPTTSVSKHGTRSVSGASPQSSSSTRSDRRFGAHGISLGAGKAAEGLLSHDVAGFGSEAKDKRASGPTGQFKT